MIPGMYLRANPVLSKYLKPVINDNFLRGNYK